MDRAKQLALEKAKAAANANKGTPPPAANTTGKSANASRPPPAQATRPPAASIQPKTPASGTTRTSSQPPAGSTAKRPVVGGRAPTPPAEKVEAGPPPAVKAGPGCEFWFPDQHSWSSKKLSLTDF